MTKKAKRWRDNTVQQRNVVWVDRQEDLPQGKLAHSEGVIGFHTHDAIYGIKGVTPKSTILHETYHARQGRPDTDTIRKLVAEELEANRYAYSKIGKPAGLLSRLRGIWHTVIHDSAEMGGALSPSVALYVLHQELLKIDPPKQWLLDYRKLVDEIHANWVKKKDDKDSLYYQDYEPQLSESLVAREAGLKARTRKTTYTVASKTIKTSKGGSSESIGAVL